MAMEESKCGTFSSAVDMNEVKRQTRVKAYEAKEQVKEKAHHMKEDATERVRSGISSQKDRMTQGLETIADALRQTSRNLTEKNQGSIACYTEGIADQVDRFSGYFREKDINEFVHEAEDLARRRPGLFLGAAFAMGFLLARFLKSSSQGRSEGRYSLRDYPRESWRSEGHGRTMIKEHSAYGGGPFGEERVSH